MQERAALKEGDIVTDIELPEALLMRWVEETIGRFRVVSRYAHSHGCSHLWRLQADREFFWLKRHQSPGKCAGEAHALTRWTPALNLAAPQVRGYRTEPVALLLTEASGEMASAVDLEPVAEARLWRAAGAYLARLHALENDWLGAIHLDGSVQGQRCEDPVRFVRQSLESRLAQGAAQDLFDAGEREFIRYGMDAWTAALADETPRAIHRDYSPRNWMTDASGRLNAVIDFEHSRWDVRAADLNRWWDTDFLEKPVLAEAFFDGYQGAMPDEKLWAQILALRLLGAAAGIVWATRVGDAPYVQVNREALHRLMQEQRGR